MNVTFVPKADIDKLIKMLRQRREMMAQSHCIAWMGHCQDTLYHSRKIEKKTGIPASSLVDIIDGALGLSDDVPNLNIYQALERLGIITVVN